MGEHLPPVFVRVGDVLVDPAEVAAVFDVSANECQLVFRRSGAMLLVTGCSSEAAGRVLAEALRPRTTA